jgi:outer membrane protein with beta-barrel domain
MRFADRFVISLALAALAPVAAAQERIDWSKWYAGAGIGPGISAHYRQDGRTLNFDEGMQGATDKSALAGFNIGGGIQLDSRTLVGLGGSAVGKTAKINGNDAHTQINNYFVLATYFPYERGFFVRAGGGYANILVDNGTTSERTGGAGVQLGAGWAWRLVTQHYLTLAVDQSFQFYRSNSDHRPTRSEFSAAYLGYMYRR